VLLLIIIIVVVVMVVVVIIACVRPIMTVNYITAQSS
jgi:uncharacterized membrane protein YciS (DUF1049 family)